jgi:Glutathione S-transferase, N-terminal domain
MTIETQTFSLGSEGDDDGSFKRQESVFRNWVTADGSSGFAPERGRYHLYVARACPWADRTLIGRRLMGLQDAIGVSYVDPLRDGLGWAFTGGDYTDAVNGFRYLSEAYAAADPGYQARVSVPVLWDRQQGTIVDNESADILRMLSTVFAPLAEHPVELYPERLRDEIDELNELIYEGVNNAVYKAGFSTRQEPTSARSTASSRRSTSSTGGSPTGAFSSVPSRSRPTGGCSRPWCASTPCTRSSSSARSASWPSTSTCGLTRGTCTSGRPSRRPSISTRSARTTTGRTR